MAPALEASLAEQQVQDGERGGAENILTSNTNNEEITYNYKVTIVGSGNWGSVASKLIASNTLKLSSFHGLNFAILV